MKQSAVRILVVDDAEPWRRFFGTMLQNVTEMQVISEASDGIAGVQQAQEMQPDMILLDIGLPLLNGIEAARRIREVSPGSKILFVTENRSWDIAQEALRSGGSGYVVKSNAASELLPAVKAILQGKPFLSVGLTGLNSNHSEGDDDASPARQEKVAASHPNCEVNLYPDDAELVGGFARLITAAMKNGEGVFTVVTETQRAGIARELISHGLDVAALFERKLDVPLDGVDTQARSMGKASPKNGCGSSDVVPDAIEKALRTAKDRDLRAAFG